MSTDFENSLIDCFSPVKGKNISVLFEDPKVFVCGGPVYQDRNKDPEISVIPQSFRERFINHFRDHNFDNITEDNIVLAEEFNDYFKDNIYQDLLIFEKDIAEISSLILIFLESAGSLVELGIFCTTPKLYEKIIIIAPKEYTEKRDSFIYLGPIENIRRGNKGTVLFYPWPSKKELKYNPLHLEAVHEKVKDRITHIKKSKKFDNTNSGHITLLIAEIIRLCFPITKDEVELAILALDLDMDNNQLERGFYLGKTLRIFNNTNYDQKDYYYPLYNKKQYANITKLDKTHVLMKVRQTFTLNNDLNSRTRLHVLQEVLDLIKPSGEKK